MASSSAASQETGNVKDIPMTDGEKSPVCIVVLGMAGSGKTTLVQVSGTEASSQMVLIILFLATDQLSLQE